MARAQAGTTTSPSSWSTSSTTTTGRRPRPPRWPTTRGWRSPPRSGKGSPTTATGARELASGGPPGPRTGRGRSRPITFRVVGFIVLLAALVAGAFAAIGFYARGSYFVAVAADQLTIYKGRPGGLLWFQPTVVERTNVTTSAVLPSRISDLQRGQQEATVADARRYVDNLEAEGQAHGIGSTTTTSAAATTTTTAAAPGATSPGDDHRPHHRGRRRRLPLRESPDRDPGPRPPPHRARVDRARRPPDRGPLRPRQPRQGGDLPANIGPFLAIIFGLLLLAHLAMRRLAPDADPILLPTAGLLNGIGYVFIARLSSHLAGLQAVWTAIGIGGLHRHPDRGAPGPGPRALPLHLRLRRHRPPAASPRARRRREHQRGPPVGPRRRRQLPARRAGQDRPGHLLRLRTWSSEPTC